MYKGENRVDFTWLITAFLYLNVKNNLTYKVKPHWKYYENTKYIKWRIKGI